jgi:hypothetical protein
MSAWRTNIGHLKPLQRATFSSLYKCFAMIFLRNRTENNQVMALFPAKFKK